MLAPTSSMDNITNNMTRKMSMTKKMKMANKNMTAINISRIWKRASKKIRLTWKEKMKRMRTTTTSTRCEASTIPLTI
jgi:hypothetical protein